ncbi:LCP family protein, partial [bacterium]|nr:LCP family protein [bacterium]
IAWYWWLVWVFTGLMAVVLTVWLGSRQVIPGGNESVLLTEATREAEIIPQEVIDPLRPIYVALLGHGGGNHAGGALADTIMVAQVVPRQQRVNLFSVPRDLWVELPLTRSSESDEPMWSKINSTLAIGSSSKQYTWRSEEYQGTHGGGALAKKVLGDVLGQPIDYYIAVDFSGFVKLIELLGGKEGLSINVPYSFVDEYYPIEGEEDNTCGFSEDDIATMSATLSGFELEKQFTCRFERLEFNAGKQMITPEQLLKFVRSRHAAVGGSDFARSQRQQVVLEAIKKKLWNVKTIPKVPAIAAQAIKIVRTDIDVDLVSKVLTDYGDISEFELKSYVLDNKTYLQDGRSRDGQYILRPRAGEGDYHEIHEWVLQALEASGEAEMEK